MQEVNRDKALVVFSGGQDSTTCLYWAMRHFKEVWALTFVYGQKHVAEGYNTFAGECVSEPLRNAFLSILNDEHAIQADVFSVMQSKGWYPVECAEPQKIQQARQKFSQQP